MSALASGVDKCFDIALLKRRLELAAISFIETPFPSAFPKIAKVTWRFIGHRATRFVRNFSTDHDCRQVSPVITLASVDSRPITEIEVGLSEGAYVEIVDLGNT